MQTKEQKQERPGIKAIEAITWLCTCSGCLWIMIVHKNYITLTALSLISCWKASFSFLNEVRYFCKDSSDKHITIIYHCRQERSYRPVLPLNFHKEENTLSQAFQDWKLWRPVQKWRANVWSGSLPEQQLTSTCLTNSTSASYMIMYLGLSSLSTFVRW